MARASRFFVVAYAALLTVLAVVGLEFIGTHYHSVENNALWVVALWWNESGGLTVAYLILSIGLLLAWKSGGLPSCGWLVAATVPIALQVSVIAALADSSDPVYWQEVVGIVIYELMRLCYLALLLWIARDLGRSASARGQNWRRAAFFGALPAGAALVLLSLFSTVISRGFIFRGPEHSGWEILAQKAHWTEAISFAMQCGNTLWTWPWLYSVENILGYAFYLTALAASVALLIWLAMALLRRGHLQNFRIPAMFAAVFSFLLFAFSTEAFWSKQEYSGAASWITILAMVLCVSAPIYALVLLIPAVRGRCGTDRWRVLMYFQMPVVGYFFVVYLEQTILDFAPGVLALMAGLQLECLACIGLLVIPAAQEIKAPKVAHAAH